MPCGRLISFSRVTSKPCLVLAESVPSKRSVICGTMRVVVPIGDGRLGVPHMEDLDGAADVLQLVLAAVDEGVLDAQLDQVAHGARHGDAAGLGQRLDAGGEVDAVAEDVLVLVVDDDLAEMHADAEHHALLVGSSVSLKRAMRSWMSMRGADGGHGRAELGQHGIARGADQAAAGGLDGRPPDLDLRRSSGAGRCASRRPPSCG